MSRLRRTLADESFLILRSSVANVARDHLIGDHTHDWHQLVFAASGVMTVSTEEGSWVTPPSWAIWVNAGVRHSIQFAGSADLRTLYFRPGRSTRIIQRCSVISVGPFLRALILHAIELGMLDRRDPLHRALNRLLLHAIRTEPAAPFDLPLPESEALREIAQDLCERPACPDSIARLAERAGLGVRTLERRFRAETGLSLGVWRRQARMCHALRQLAAGHSVKEVAPESGYQSASAFVSAFRSIFSTTPAKYFRGG